MSRLKKIVLIICVAFLSILCALTLAVGIFYTSLTNIHKVTITRGVFDIVGKTSEFKLSGLKKGTEYNVIMRFYYPRPLGDSFKEFKGRALEGSNYTAEIEAFEDNKIIKKVELRRDSNKTKSWSADFFELYLIDIEGKPNHPATLKATFFSDDAFFNKLEKELYFKKSMIMPRSPIGI